MHNYFIMNVNGGESLANSKIKIRLLKKILKIIAVVLVLAFAALQFYRPDRTNPTVNPAETLEASTDLPSDVRAVLQRSCNDCHSNETSYPWYSNVSPFSWFLDDHIRHGRSELNFSVWNTYEKSRKMRKLDEICEVIESSEMPLPSYLWIHRDAVLKSENARRLCSWAADEKTRVLASGQ